MKIRLKYLLDTHTLIWAVTDEDKLGAEAARVIAVTPYDQLAISDITLQEIGLIYHARKISFAGTPATALAPMLPFSDRAADQPRSRLVGSFTRFAAR